MSNRQPSANDTRLRALVLSAVIAAACGTDSQPDQRGISTAGSVSVVVPPGPAATAGTSSGSRSNAAGIGEPTAGTGPIGIPNAGANVVRAGAPGAIAGAPGVAGAAGSGPTTPPPPGGSCAMSAARVRITEIDVGSKVLSGDTDQTFYMLAISPIPAGGSRLAWLSGDNNIHIAQLDAEDHLVGAPFVIAGHDFSD